MQIQTTISFFHLRHIVEIDLCNSFAENLSFAHHTMAAVQGVFITILCTVVPRVHDQARAAVPEEVHDLRASLQHAALQTQMLHMIN